MSAVTLYQGDCLELLPTLAANSIDAIVCDPPYGLSFMGKNWDHGVPGVAFWEAALRVAKPGAMLLAFGGTRTFHRLTVAIEDAGWEIRDCLMWLYGSGFPKSLDISKAIDKAAGAEREQLGLSPNRRPGHESGKSWKQSSPHSMDYQLTAPATDAARQWHGYGTALKPAWEPIIMAMKPLDGTFANNALVHGVAGLNIDACRIGIDETERRVIDNRSGKGWGTNQCAFGGRDEGRYQSHAQGRWPANVLLDEEAAAALDQMSGERPGGARPATRNVSHFGNGNGTQDGERIEYSAGGASRFFYCAKSSKRDRDEGLEGMEERTRNSYSGAESRVGKVRSDGAIQNAANTTSRNHHPTVKPTQLMRYLVRLVTPANGIILDPFMGSGSTGKAAVLEGFHFIGIEKEDEYLTIAEKRIAHAQSTAEQAQAQPALLEVA